MERIDCSSTGNCNARISSFSVILTICVRVDLHEALKALAVSDTLPGEPAIIQIASRVTSCDCENGIVYLESGEEFRGDLVIGADGV